MSSVFKGKFTRIASLGDWVRFVGARSVHHAMQYYGDYRPDSFPCLMRRVGELAESNSPIFMIIEHQDLKELLDQLEAGDAPPKPKKITNRMAKMLRIILSRPGLGYTATEIVKELYNHSEQPHKKTVNIYKDLDWMARNGVLYKTGGASSFRYTEVRFMSTALTQQVLESKTIPDEELVI